MNSVVVERLTTFSHSGTASWLVVGRSFGFVEFVDFLDRIRRARTGEFAGVLVAVLVVVGNFGRCSGCSGFVKSVVNGMPVGNSRLYIWCRWRSGVGIRDLWCFETLERM